MPDIWFKMYPRDWAADVQLNRCSLASREVWQRMGFIMREAEPFGFFVGRSGEPVDIAWFAREVNAPLREVKKCLAELEHEGVFSRDSFGRIYSRRLIREHAKREQLRENGQHGGNPALLDNHSLDKQFGYPEPPKMDKRGLVIPDTRYQIPDTDSLRSSAMGFERWPSEIPKLRELALLFIAAFGNCRDPIKAEKYLPHYTQVLAQMRSRGVSMADAWQACADAREANNGKPLFAATIKSAMSFLPARGSAPQSKPSAYAGLQVFGGGKEIA